VRRGHRRRELDVGGVAIHVEPAEPEQVALSVVSAWPAARQWNENAFSSSSVAI
jgi:hypothetical protein